MCIEASIQSRMPGIGKRFEMNPNKEQINSAIRWLVTVFGAGIAGWLAHSGYVTAQQVTDALNSPAFLSLAFSMASGIIGLIAHTQKNAVAVVTAIAADPNSPVVGIVTTNTPEGRAMASVPHAEIAVANSPAANAISKDNVPPLAPKTP
jgi:hypothetical protein